MFELKSNYYKIYDVVDNDAVLLQVIFTAFAVIAPISAAINSGE